jgi:hypothetical protein
MPLHYCCLNGGGRASSQGLHDVQEATETTTPFSPQYVIRGASNYMPPHRVVESFGTFPLKRHRLPLLWVRRRGVLENRCCNAMCMCSHFLSRRGSDPGWAVLAAYNSEFASYPRPWTDIRPTGTQREAAKGDAQIRMWNGLRLRHKLVRFQRHGDYKTCSCGLQLEPQLHI